MPVVAVLDIGKTNLKVLAIGLEGRVRETLTAANVAQPAPPYLHVDLAAVEAWVLSALGQLAARHQVAAVVATAHGSGAVLVDDAGPVLPMMDYEAEPPAEIAQAYAAMAPAYDESFALATPPAMRVACQLLWQQRFWPEAFARARRPLTSPQYWAWRLSGVAAAEITSLGAQTHLWAHAHARPAGIVAAQGWDRLLPPRQPPWGLLGPITPAVAAATGLPAGTPVLNGIHDSSANYFRYVAAGLGRFVLLSTGTWLVGFNPWLKLARLDPARAMVANADPEGRPLATVLVMTGRDYAIIAGGAAEQPDAGDIAALVAAGTMALPSFAAHDGCFPGSAGRGRFEGPAPETTAGRVALATLYAAQVAARCLELLEADAPVIVDGGFAANLLFAETLAALRPDLTILVSDSRDGTAIGAAQLWARATGATPAPLSLRIAPPLALPGLADYAKRWAVRAENLDASG